MSVFSRLFFNREQHNSPQKHDKCHTDGAFSPAAIASEDDFDICFPVKSRSGDSFLYNAWVNIAISILIRNIARADFVIKKGGNEVTCGPLYDLFKRPNTRLSRYDLWKETAAWWSLEGEAFWWFGPEYTGGLPKELYVLNPRLLHHEGHELGKTYHGVAAQARRWFYCAGAERIPILSDELIHFRDWPSAVSPPVRLFRAASVRCRRHPCRLFLPLVGADYGTSPCGLVPVESGAGG